MDRALRNPAGNSALPQPRRRPLRPPPRHPLRHPRHRRDVRRGGPTVDGRDRRRRARDGDPLHHGERLSLRAQHPGLQGHRLFRRRDLPHRRLARGRGRLYGPAGGHHRHRLLGHPVHSAHRRTGGASLRLPAHAELQRSRVQRAAGPGGAEGGQGGLRGPSGAGAAEPLGHRFHGRRERRVRRRPRGARGRLRRALADLRHRLPGRVLRSLRDRGGQRHGGRIRPLQDSRDGARPGGGRAALAPLPHRLQADLRRHRLLRDLQPGQRHPGRRQRDADRGDHSRRPQGGRSRVRI